MAVQPLHDRLLVRRIEAKEIANGDRGESLLILPEDEFLMVVT